ncbi:AAA family ATPase [Streptomyces sp. I05A-00742]|uniref:ATP-binding protein n=1 Tax=Streptomyces sp. I05A-00742 TaxID=2732853 RepID=UPI0014894973|nr:AAA family ATPase [Streptomyces sp. I05A-00742]
MTRQEHERRPYTALFERDQEVAVAERAMAALCGETDGNGPAAGGLLLFSGEAGVGKTALLGEMRRLAVDRGGCTVLSARGGEQAQSVPFHVVRQLLQPALAPMEERQRREMLGEWYDIAGPALGIAPPVGPQADPQGVRDGLDWLVTQFALTKERLLLIVDDAHWADAASLAWLTSFAVRLTDLPILLAVAYRPEELPAHSPAFADLVKGRGNRPVTLHPLTPGAVAELVRTAMGRDADDPFCREVWAVTGGNPYEAVELVAKARDRSLRPMEESAALLRELGAAARGSGLVARLERLGNATTRFAWGASVLGTEIPVRVAAMLAGMSPAEGAVCADRLREARILTGVTDLEFVHPLIATAVYRAIPDAARTAMHGLAAWAVTNAGHGPAAASRHLLEVHPDGDPDLVRQLREAAREHLAVGAPEAAQRCLERALAEPPPEEDRAEVLYELGCSALLTSPPTTINHLRSALSLSGLPKDLRVDATYRLSQAYAHNSQLTEAAEVVAEHAVHTPDGPGRMRLQAAHFLWKGIQLEEEGAHTRSREIAGLTERLSGRDNAERALLALRAFDAMIQGEDVLQVIELADRVLVDGRLADGMGWTNTEWGFELPSIIGITYAFSDRLDRAEELFGEAVREFEISGWRGGHLAFAHEFLGLVHRRRGDLRRAESFLRDGLKLADRLGPGVPIQWDGSCLLIDTLLAKGDVVEAQAVAEKYSFGPPYPPAMVMPDAACVVGRLLLALGRTKEAIAELEAAGHRLEERGRHNVMWAPWSLDLATAVAAEDPERAKELADRSLRYAMRFGTDTAIGEALRRSASLVGPAEALPRLEQAVQHLVRSPCRYEYARALVDQGTALHRAGRGGEAGAPLREGLRLAGECGADELAGTARAELTALGEAPGTD